MCKGFLMEFMWISLCEKVISCGFPFRTRHFPASSFLSSLSFKERWMGVASEEPLGSLLDLKWAQDWRLGFPRSPFLPLSGHVVCII